MADMDTPEDLASFSEEKAKALGAKLKDLTIELAGDAVELTAEQAIDLLALSEGAVKAIAGDDRLAAHLKAQLSLQRFSAEARAYLEAAEFRKAFADAIVEVAKEIVVEGAPIVVKLLVGALGAA